MELRAKVKLKFSIKKVILEIKYNTFEKATFDQYLCASILRNVENDAAMDTYIDDITGTGSLNAHFKRLCEGAKALSADQLANIIATSQYPTLKVDRSNYFFYYEELGCSMFRRKVYKMDLSTSSTERLVAMVGITDPVISLNFHPEQKQSTDVYEVLFNNGKIFVQLGDTWQDISSELFEKALVRELDPTLIPKIKSKIRQEAEGEGWKILNNDVLKRITKDDELSFTTDDAHYLICKQDLLENVVVEIYGMYLYKESRIAYRKAPEWGQYTLYQLLQKQAFGLVEKATILQLLQCADVIYKQAALNDLFGRYPNEVAYIQEGLSILGDADNSKWSPTALFLFRKHATDERTLTLLYMCAHAPSFDVEQLAKLDRTILRPADRARLEEHFASIENIKHDIKRLIGDVTTSGLREGAKALRADEETREFSKLCNNLIGHVENDIDALPLAELKQWYEKAQRLATLAEKIKTKLKEQN